jgi:sterol desaturase/sphingolipid hydroxylase (fatty acid hydroxylase superfamily)
MEDLRFGIRDERGNWSPRARLEIPPYWAWPPRFIDVLKWLPKYLFPWNAYFMATALAYWYFVIPDLEVMKTLSWGWALPLYGVNAAAVFVSYGAVELLYYVRRKQGTRFKYNAAFPADHPSSVFWFKSQNIDNFLRTFLSGISMWTAVEVLMLHGFANGYASWLGWADHPLYLAGLVFVAPMIHEVHFFLIHRLIHTPFLYKWVHSVHHHSVNPSPWSSLSMHPVEAFLYHAVALWHLVIPSNPLVALFQLHVAGFGALNGHFGFDKLEITEDWALDGEAYSHYLHHKYFTVNYGGDGLIPLDKWFGSWHDGSAQAEAAMRERSRRKRDKSKRERQPTAGAA